MDSGYRDPFQATPLGNSFISTLTPTAGRGLRPSPSTAGRVWLQQLISRMSGLDAFFLEAFCHHLKLSILEAFCRHCFFVFFMIFGRFWAPGHVPLDPGRNSVQNALIDASGGFIWGFCLTKTDISCYFVSNTILCFSLTKRRLFLFFRFWVWSSLIIHDHH